MNTVGITLGMLCTVITALPGVYEGKGLYPGKVPKTLVCAAAYGKIDQVQRYLAGTPKKEELNRALTRASCGGHAEIAARLVEAGADLDCECWGLNPLMHAISNRQLSVVQALHKRGAQLSDAQREKLHQDDYEWYKKWHEERSADT